MCCVVDHLQAGSAARALGKRIGLRRINLELHNQKIQKEAVFILADMQILFYFFNFGSYLWEWAP